MFITVHNADKASCFVNLEQIKLIANNGPRGSIIFFSNDPDGLLVTERVDQLQKLITDARRRIV